MSGSKMVNHPSPSVNSKQDYPSILINSKKLNTQITSTLPKRIQKAQMPERLIIKYLKT